MFFLAFATLSTLFVLKDGPVMHRFINRHLGVPQPVANVVTTNVAKSLRSYFLGVTIIAAFNAVVIGGAALILGVPLAGTIAVVTFAGAYVPFVGAWVAGAFAVLIALGGAVGTSADDAAQGRQQTHAGGRFARRVIATIGAPRDDDGYAGAVPRRAQGAAAAARGPR